jgi:hypothetical protein
MPRRAPDEFGPKIGLERGDLLADGGLAQTQFARHEGEAAASDHPHEGPHEVYSVHGVTIPSWHQSYSIDLHSPSCSEWIASSAPTP